jgi:hypothetical protein
MDHSRNGINIVGDYIEEEWYLRREWKKILEIGSGRIQVMSK